MTLSEISEVINVVVEGTGAEAVYFGSTAELNNTEIPRASVCVVFSKMEITNQGAKTLEATFWVVIKRTESIIDTLSKAERLGIAIFNAFVQKNLTLSENVTFLPYLYNFATEAAGVSFTLPIIYEGESIC